MRDAEDPLADRRDAGMHPATLWEAHADRLGDEPAIIQASATTTWRDFDRHASAVAGALQAVGIGEQGKVAVYLYNGAEFLETCFAAFKFRAQPINVNYRYLDAELAHLLESSDAQALVFHGSLSDRVAGIDTSALRLLAQVPDGDATVLAGAVPWAALLGATPAARCVRGELDHHLLYTGGTTGLPKGVIYEVGGLARELVSVGASFIGAQAPSCAADVATLGSDSRAAGTHLVTLILPPLMHGTGMGLAFLTLSVGGTVVLLDGPRFDADEALRAIERSRVSVLSLVGDAFGRPLAAALDAAATGCAYDVSSLRVIMSSGAMLTAETKATLLRHAPNALIIDSLAASEAPMGSSVSHAGSTSSTATFAMRPGTKVLDENDREVAPGSGIAGRVAVASTNPIGYYKDPEKTAETFREIDGIRYTFPGDWAVIDEDGTLVLLGRGSHCINTGGEKVFPEEVEEALKTHPAVVDALVFGVDDEKWGQRIEAVASTEAPVTSATLSAHVKARLAAFKVPKVIQVVDAVPRAANGKADYREARRLAGHGH